MYPRVIGVVEVRGGRRKCRTWRGEKVYVGGRYVVVEGGRLWPVGGGFGARGGNQNKEAGQ